VIIDDRNDKNITRREFLKKTGISTAAAISANSLRGIPFAATAASGFAKSTDTIQPYNILFILTDQERYIPEDKLPPGYHLPGHHKLHQRGVTFTNHQICSAVCSSSRSVIYTGQHIQHTGVFDNLNVPWVKNLSPDIRTIGDMLNDASYYAAYKGKWHLSSELDTHEEFAIPQAELTKVIESYGFNDYVGIGDIIGETHGGYINDDIIGAQSQRWLRLNGKHLNQQGKPWCLSVNLVNPHDVYHLAATIFEIALQLYRH